MVRVVARRRWPAIQVARGLLHLLAGLSLVLWSSSVFAAIKTEVSARRVGVGQSFTVQVTATQEDGQPEPTAPQIKVSGGAQVQGPSISTQSMVRMHNFSFSSEKSVVARWQVTATQKGKLTIGPGTFQVAGKRIAGETIVVEVVDTDQVPQPPQRRRRSLFGSDPLDPFGSDPFGSDPFDDFFKRQNLRQQIPQAPAEYQLSRAPDPIAFLVPRLSRKNVVVGEPVTLTILAYGARGDFGEAMPPTGPALADFLSYRVLDNPQAEPPYQLQIGDTTYVVRKLRELLIIPLKTGSLEVGSLSTVLQNNRRSYPGKDSDQGYSVVSAPLALKVSAPPEKGRPPGYLIGDVGRYRLFAELSQEEVVQGEFAELTVRIEGQGQIPSQVLLPEQNGVIWEAPTMSGGPEITDGELQGTRVLKYAFQLTAQGTVELGEVMLPIFDHKSRRYSILRAKLGAIEVKAATPSAPVSQPSTPISTGGAQDAPKASSSASLPLSARTRPMVWEAKSHQMFPVWAWWAMIVTPLSVFAGGLARRSLSALLRRRAASPGSNVKTELKEAEEALQNGDAHLGLRLSERALFEAVERATGLKARGVLRSEVEKSLSDVGLKKALAERVQDLLIRLEACRYGSTQDDPQTLLSEVRKLTQSLPTSKKGVAHEL